MSATPSLEVLNGTCQPPEARISIVIPLYNKEAYVERTLRSVYGQTYRHFELIVVNDGSTDGSVAVVEAIADSRTRIIHQYNQGVSAARNRGIKEAKSGYIALLDADDEWKPSHLATLTGLIDRYPDCGIYGACYAVRKDGEEKAYSTALGRLPFPGEDGVLDNFFELASGIFSPLQMSCSAVRKELIESVGGFPVGILTGEDQLTIAKLAIQADIAYSRNETSIYNIISQGKNYRSTLRDNPMDEFFDSLPRQAPHRKGIRLYTSSWHKRRMVNALIANQYGTACKQFFIASRFYPFQKKLYTSLLSVLISKITGLDMYTINMKLIEYHFK